MMSPDDPRPDEPVVEVANGTLDVEHVPDADTEGDAEPAPPTFIGPRATERRGIESVFVRLVATSGIVGISVGLAAILGTQDVAFWIVGLIVSLVSVVLAAILWSSRTL